MKKFDAAQSALCVHQARVTIIGTFSPMLEQILDYATTHDLDLSHLKSVFGIAPQAVIKQLHSMSPSTIFYATYGQTETTGLITSTPRRDQPDTAGRPMHLSQVRVVNELGVDQPTGKVGFIIAKGPTISPGYWKQPTSPTPITQLGWHDTGDLGTLDTEGTLNFRGPAPHKRLIKSGGENVYPAEVEHALRTHPDVKEAMVVGIPDQEWGETVGALCICHNNSSLDTNTLSEYVATRVARYKRPRHIHFVTTLPKTNEGLPDLEAARNLLLTQANK